MPDPFDALHASIAPVEPDPAFAARLRARLQRALALPEGVDMPRSVPAPHESTAAVPGGGTAGSGGVIPYLAVADARRALAWYADALGARPGGDPIVMPDGRIGHAELELAGGRVMLSDEHPEIGVVAPMGEGATVTLHLQVGDVDTTVERAVAAGARLDRPPADHPYGRNAVVLDPFGHRWLIAGPVPVEAAGTGAGHGDVSYASVWVPDVERAATFYAAVLGWRYAPGSAPQGRQVQGVEPPLGLWGGQDHATTFLCFAVDDVAAAVERVREAGGRAEEPRLEPHGRVADCEDDQGMPFALSETAGSPRTGSDGPRHGSLAYFVVGVADVARARRFFSTVLGWRFTPGRSEGGWDIEGVSPMGGMHGGNDLPVVVPMYAVDDVHAAVARVRAAGGTSTEPERMPYGVTAECTDDQGTAFYLGQLG